MPDDLQKLGRQQAPSADLGGVPILLIFLVSSPSGNCYFELFVAFPEYALCFLSSALKFLQIYSTVRYMPIFPFFPKTRVWA